MVKNAQNEYDTGSGGNIPETEFTDLKIDHLVVAESLTVLPALVGQVLQCNGSGVARYRIPSTGMRTVHVRSGADEDSPFEAQTVSSALIKVQALIPSPTTANPCEILIEAGAFLEPGQIYVPPGLYVAIRGTPQYSVSTLTLTTELLPGEAFLKVENGLCELTDFYIDSNNLADYTISCNNAAVFENGISMDIHRVWMAHANIACLYINNGVAYSFSAVYSLTGDQPHAVLCEGPDGAYYGYSSSVYPDESATTSTYHRATNGAFVSENDDITDGSPNSTFLKCDNNGRGALNSINIANFGTPLVMETGGQIVTTGCRFTGNTEITNAYDSTCFWTSNADQIEYSALTHESYNVDNAQILFNDQSINNRASHFIGRMAVGYRGSLNDSSMFVGQGYNDVDHMRFLSCDPSNVFIDYSESLKFSGNSLVSMFQSTAANNAFYIGDETPQKFSSLIFDVVTPLVGSNIILEYWSGSAWTSLNYMFSKASSPYQPYANLMFSTIEAQVCRTDITLLLGNTWAITTVNGISGYWLRFRLTGSITTIPQIFSIAIYGNMTNITSDGLLIHHGKSRTAKNIPYDYNLTLGTPTDATMYFSPNIYIDRVNNKFSNAGTQAISFAFSCPTDLDSSCPLTMRFQFCSDAVAAGQLGFSFTLYLASIASGTTYLTTASGSPLATETATNITLMPNSTNGRNLVFSTSPNIYLPQIRNSNETGATTHMIIGKLLRNSGDNTNAALIAQIGLYYYSYRTTNIYIN